MKMSIQKKLIILGAHTIFSDKCFINDEVPRILGGYIEDGFRIELLQVLPDDEQTFNEAQMPFWLRENIFIIDKINDKEKLDKESFAITDNPELQKLVKINIPVYTNFFESLSFDKFNIVDLLVCFGFSDKEFKHFCKTNNLLGFENGVIIDKKIKMSNAVAVSVDSDNIKETYDYAVSKFKSAVDSNMYKVKHDSTSLGVTYHGRGIDNGVGYLPLIFI